MAPKSKSALTIAFSTNYKDHERLIHMLARRAYARLVAAKVNSYEYLDVFQDMSLSFVKAAEKWNPELGITFTAYFGRAAFYDFNHKVKKLTLQSVPTVNFEDLKEMLVSNGEDVEALDISEFILGADGAFVEAAEETVERQQTALFNMGRLSDAARAVVADLIDPSDELKGAFSAAQEHHAFAKEVGECPNIPRPTKINMAFIARHRGIDKNRLRKVKAELNTVYGVDI